MLSVLTFQYSIGQSDNCLEFDGVNDYVFIGDVNNLETSDFTIESWIYLNSTTGNGNKIINKGLSSAGNPSNAGYALRAGKTGSDEIEFQIGHSNGSSKRVIYNGITTNRWYHVAGVRLEKKLYLYLDGVLVKEDTTNTTFNVDTDLPLVLGAIHKGSSYPVNEFINGKIDEVRIWNTARTKDEINAYKNCSITSAQPNLLAVYNLNETDLNTAYDLSGNSNNGNLINGPVWSNSTVALECITSSNEVSNSPDFIYPNPFQTEIFVKGDFDQFNIFDITGSLVLSGKYNGNVINVDKLVKGSYILEVSKGKKITRFKIARK